MSPLHSLLTRSFLRLRHHANGARQPFVRALLRAQGVVLHGPLATSGWPYVINLGAIEIGAGATLVSSRANPVGGSTRMSIVVQRNARLSIGAGAGLSNCEIFCAREIAIGEHTLVGGGVRIYDTDFHSLDPDARRVSPDRTVRSAPVHIGRDCFIGGSATILKGVTVGDGAVIGASSVVARDVPPGEVWAGNPARFVRLVRPAAPAQSTP